MSKQKKQSRVTQNTLNTAKRLLKYMTETYKVQFIIVFICILLSSIGTISVSLSLKFLLDDFIIPLIGQQTPDFSGLYSACGPCLYLPCGSGGDLYLYQNDGIYRTGRPEKSQGRYV